MLLLRSVSNSTARQTSLCMGEACLGQDDSGLIHSKYGNVKLARAVFSPIYLLVRQEGEYHKTCIYLK